VCTTQLDSPPQLVQIGATLLTSFDEARAVFVRVINWLQSAKDMYYTFNDHATDATEIAQDMLNVREATSPHLLIRVYLKNRKKGTTENHHCPTHD
jgi:hypothetical protein